MGTERCSKSREASPQSCPPPGPRRPGVSGSILEGLDEILTVSRLGLPAELRRSLACTNIIENMNGTIRRVCRNVKRWNDASMALRWTGAAMMEAAKGFLRRLKACKHLPALRAALTAHQLKQTKGAFRGGGWYLAGTAAHPLTAGALQNRPDVRSRDGFQMTAGWMRAGLLRPGRRLKAPEEGNRGRQRCAMRF